MSYDLLNYWQQEGEQYNRHGDYAWMAAQVPGNRVLEIGCGPGFSTVALLLAQKKILVLEPLSTCLETMQRYIQLHNQEQGNSQPQPDAVQCDIQKINESTQARIANFVPETVLCWLMGANADDKEAGQSEVTAYREAVHRHILELAARTPSIKTVHLVDRTIIPWQAKDLARDTLVQYHTERTLKGLPFNTVRSDALYRQLAHNATDLQEGLGRIRRSSPRLTSVKPVLASILIRRID